jgi:hypothetical protein
LLNPWKIQERGLRDPSRHTSNHSNIRAENAQGCNFGGEHPVASNPKQSIGRFEIQTASAASRLHSGFRLLQIKVVELDGSQHSGSNSDVERDKCLNASSFKTLRFWNDEIIRNLDGVCSQILHEANKRQSGVHIPLSGDF